MSVLLAISKLEKGCVKIKGYVCMYVCVGEAGAKEGARGETSVRKMEEILRQMMLIS